MQIYYALEDMGFVVEATYVEQGMGYIGFYTNGVDTCETANVTAQVRSFEQCSEALQISNVMLYRFIDEWYGVKYRMGGTTKKGVDCSAFVQHLYQYVFGYNILRTACLQFKESKKIAKDDLKEGDLVFFKVGTSRISHVGVYLRNNFFVHSASSKGVSIANLSNAYWSRYFAGGGRIVKE
jgi:lipoprotein Spr